MIKVRFKEDGKIPDFEMDFSKIEKGQNMEDYEKVVNELCEELNYSLKKFVKAMATCFNQRKMLQVDTPIEALGLTQRSYHCLKRANINTVEQLSKKTKYQLMNIRNLGRNSLNEIISKLESYGIKLMED